LGAEDGEDHPPASAAAWVRREAQEVRVEYLFRVHAVHSRDEQASAAVEAALSLLHVELGGLAYAEQQGFSLTIDDADWQITWHPAMNRSRPGGLAANGRVRRRELGAIRDGHRRPGAPGGVLPQRSAGRDRPGGTPNP
jgi:hypothetical protein